MLTQFSFFFFNDTATTEIYTLSLHDALPILPDDGAVRRRATERQRVTPGLQLRERHRPVDGDGLRRRRTAQRVAALERDGVAVRIEVRACRGGHHLNTPGGGRGRGLRPLARQSHQKRSEEHTSELQSLAYLVCRLLLEKKKKEEQRR